jgi:hypothetical protein
MKICSLCKVEKAAQEFYKDSQKKTGLTSKCKACMKPINKKYGQANKEKRNAYHKEWYQENREKRLNQCSEWAKANRDKKNSHWMKRHLTKLNQTPEMFDDEKRMIEALYTKARRMTEMSGTQYHVDHIIPVCQGGLHCYMNLQILTAKENLSKGGALSR